MRSLFHSDYRACAIGLLLLVACLCVVPAMVSPIAYAQGVDSGEAQWIWTPEHASDRAPEGAVYFRKAFSMGNPERGQIAITSDNEYELYVNGRHVGSGQDWHVLDVYDIRPYLLQGRNAIAVKAVNDSPSAAGLVAYVTVKDAGNTDVSYSTDAGWRVTTQESPRWQHRRFEDVTWLRARVLGEFGKTPPWGDEIRTSGGTSAGRFRLPSQFVVERVAHPDNTGSIIAMTFNERGEIIASREKGPLLRIRDDDGDGAPEAVHIYSDKMQNCQGMLALNGHLFVVGDGPEGTSFCRLSDEDGDGQAETVKTLLKFRGDMGEHGPHVPVLGPDGLIYLVIGNHSGPLKEHSPDSPHHDYYEGDLVQPRYEDAGGHAHGIKAPGGIILRTDLEGSFIDVYAGGFRNAYDIAFNRQGDLLTYDSDMEWDEGLPWYRPTRVNHVIPGAEFGWRSGWAKWPDYYVDSLPAIVDVGRGSPTGVIVYNHVKFPVRYQNALFAADWSLGRILVVKMKPNSGTYAARGEVFLQGRPLNVTDLDVGPDGWLYFSTGGRGTEGGIYRIRYLGSIPPRSRPRGIMQAIEQPQLQSSWARDRIATVRRQLANQWDSQIERAAENRQLTPAQRTRALTLMHLVGPFPSTDLLASLSEDPNPEVRASATYYMGIHSDATTGARLVELLDDPNPTVRRKACESLVRSRQTGPAGKLVELLGDSHRFVSWAARRALERVPRDRWQQQVLKTDNRRVFVVGATALLVVEPSRQVVDAILERGSELMQEFISDEDFVALLRVIQVALIRGNVHGDDVPALRRKLAEDYPSLEPRMNRELLKLLVYLDEPRIVDRILNELERTDNPIEEKLHAAFYARFVERGWSIEQKLELLRFHEYAHTLPGGHSFSRYVDNVRRDFVSAMSADERRRVIEHGAEMPGAALVALAKLPERLDDDLLADLVRLESSLASVEGDPARITKTGVVAVLGRSGDPQAMAYLRQLFEQFPGRRLELAMGLAQRPGGENWPLLVHALPVLEGVAAQEVLMKLVDVNRATEEAEPIRQVILCGLKLEGKGSRYAVELLEKWVGRSMSAPDASWDVALAAWQNWFRETHPNQPDPSLPVEVETDKWTFEELLAYLTDAQGAQGNLVHGRQVFEKAKCIQCHRYGNLGEGIGPDLTSVSQRFHIKEILESVLFPSHVISDQYASKTVATVDGRIYTGMVGSAGEDAIVVLQSDGEKQIIANDDVEEIGPHKKSSMPEGLFNDLTLEEIADLFAYLRKPPSGRIPTASALRLRSTP